MLPVPVRFAVVVSSLASLLGCTKEAIPTLQPAVPTPAATTFTNPLLSSGPDPWVAQKDGFYYFVATNDRNLTIRKTAKMSELGTAYSTVVWTPAASGGNVRHLWAPELYWLDGKWYLYYTAGSSTGGCCASQRLWVLENPSPDPTTGTWTEKGQLLSAGHDYSAIDATVLELGSQRYLLWCGVESTTNSEGRLYISALRNPWTLTGPRTEISRPTYDWERKGPPTNEGPEVLQHNGRTFVTYSASHCMTDDYALGLLTLTGSDPLDAASWTKSARPVFTQNPTGKAFGPGHNGFFKSKDGTQDWLLYHANSLAGQGCGDLRSPRIQPITWRADGTPDFGVPAAVGQPLPRPAGE
ncbi:glycoside hydrolase family 43 protein [Hymenobacter sp. ASUV-10]|uniref:Glycoside hydrolase family 43 protein n=1 Tax=Hymenobacter aranciens TaxID=3063996 RepID=A0ABT9BFN1_9BACT|nr:glycoside hydrolase family 43 protein [Hymenobacter sp. ASUV-10]MDO7877084.1 glycoside hydrolase family 43 protein [Hymenobacter sp. ASUV-10]